MTTKKTKKVKKVYLSAPISGYDLNERYETFEKVEKELKKLGYKVLSPMKNGLSQDEPTSHHMKRNIIMLLQADAIFLMTDWNRSARCLTELHVATACGLEVWFEGLSTVEL